MPAFFTVVASDDGRQGYIHHAPDFSISSGDASFNAANIIRVITRNSGGEMGAKLFQGFFTIHLFPTFLYSGDVRGIRRGGRDYSPVL